MQNVNVTKLQDFYSAAVILASKKLNLLKVERISGKTCLFVFQDPSGDAHKIIQSHWSRTNKVISRDLIEAIKELKTRIFLTLNEKP